MKKRAVFGLGILAGSLAVCYIEMFNARHGKVLFEDDEKIIKEAGKRTSNINTAVIFYKK